MYPSDYGFAVKETGQCTRDTKLRGSGYNIDDCKNNNWLFNETYQWTITPQTAKNGRASFRVDSLGFISNGHSVYVENGVRPTLNPAPNVKITGGTGTIDDMYQLSL